MNKPAISILLLLVVAAPAMAGQYKVTKIIDGDTINVIYKGKKERVRMLNVDIPDRSRNTTLDKEAAAYTRRRLKGKKVDLEFESGKRRRYGSLLAYVFVNGINFNVELVRKGWSKYYTKDGESVRHHAKFVTAERFAKAVGHNVWAKAQNHK